MDMVFHAADFDGLHLVLTRNATQKRPEPVAEGWRDKTPALLGAENAMEIGTNVRHTDHSAVPSGLMQFLIFPGVETPGYCHKVPPGQVPLGI